MPGRLKRYSSGTEHVIFEHINSDDHNKLTRTLQKEGLPANTYDLSGRTPLTFACINNKKAAVEILIKYSHNINQKDDNGSCPIHYASKLGSEDILRILINHGADINSKGRDSYTALHFAILEKRITIVKLLLDFGIDFFIARRNSISIDPLELAKQVGSQIIYDMLVEAKKSLPSEGVSLRRNSSHFDGGENEDDLRYSVNKLQLSTKEQKKQFKRLQAEFEEERAKISEVDRNLHDFKNTCNARLLNVEQVQNVHDNSLMKVHMMLEQVATCLGNVSNEVKNTKERLSTHVDVTDEKRNDEYEIEDAENAGSEKVIGQQQQLGYYLTVNPKEETQFPKTNIHNKHSARAVSVHNERVAAEPLLTTCTPRPISEPICALSYQGYIAPVTNVKPSCNPNYYHQTADSNCNRSDQTTAPRYTTKPSCKNQRYNLNSSYLSPALEPLNLREDTEEDVTDNEQTMAKTVMFTQMKETRYTCKVNVGHETRKQTRGDCLDSIPLKPGGKVEEDTTAMPSENQYAEINEKALESFLSSSERDSIQENFTKLTSQLSKIRREKLFEVKFLTADEVHKWKNYTDDDKQDWACTFVLGVLKGPKRNKLALQRLFRDEGFGQLANLMD